MYLAENNRRRLAQLQGTTSHRVYQPAWVVLPGLAVLSVIGLAVLGHVPGAAAGWIIRPRVAGGLVRVRRAGAVVLVGATGSHLAAAGRYLAQSWRSVLLRSLLLWGLWALSGGWGLAWLRRVPWGVWLWRGAGVGWPGLRQQAVWVWGAEGLGQVQRRRLVGYLGLALRQLCAGELASWGLGLRCVVCQQEAPQVHVARQADGSYQATLCGHFTLAGAGDHPFRMRLLVLFLSLLDAPGATRGSRRTRDDRTPCVRQMQLAAWFGVPQPHRSLWLRYWPSGAWANLLSQRTPEVLTAELVDRIVEVCATFPTWGVARVYHYLREQGRAVTEPQVQQAVQHSGWQRLQQTLSMRYDLHGAVLALRDGWLGGQLLGQIRELLGRREAGQPLPAEVRTTLADLTTLARAAGVPAPPPVKARPWLLGMEQVLLGDWALVTHGQVRCPAWGSDQVGRKSATPRLKKSYNDRHAVSESAVYRYYCRNPQGVQGRFTNLPPGLLPYSRYRTETHLLAVHMSAWGYSTYRRTGTALGVASLTAWRGVTAWGADRLPGAALFGMVRSSGVVGGDQKYVLVPKNAKPAGKMRRWMYVYRAADVGTYDLLHIAIYPTNDQASATAFLLALRAKGYQPQVIVTDLRQDDGPLLAQVFPQAGHHECLLHALQQAQQPVKDAYGPAYAEQHPEAAQLKQQIYGIFAAATLTLATARYTAVLARRPDYVQARPAAAAIFDFLERHWPRLSNSIESRLIPATNNTVERVIGRFDQHYQNFCRFESSADAQRDLAVFEKVYRCTPFAQAAQPGVRGKCPLQLAGYDISHLPMATLCAGLSIVWPVQTQETAHVPSS